MSAPDIIPPLGEPSGRVISVSTEPQLQAAVAHLSSGETIRLAPGVYRLTTTLYLGGRELTGVAIRGATNHREDVVLTGAGMTNANYGQAPYGLWTGNGVKGALIANLTIREFYLHPVILNAGTQSPHFYNVALVDGGEQLLKSNPDSNGSGVNDGVVEYSLFQYSSTSRDDYTNAIDVHAGANWIIRHNRFVNIRAPLGQLAGPAILMWRRSSGTIVDGNTFVNCQREIAFGLEPTLPSDHSGGIIRNNMIARDPGMVRGDVGILVAASPGTRVLHNTILLEGSYRNAIEYRFANTKELLIANNLTDRAIAARDGATAILKNNVTTADRTMFRNAGAGDLHLRPSAEMAIDQGEIVPDSGDDWDGDARPAGSAPDIGADEIADAH